MQKRSTEVNQLKLVMKRENSDGKLGEKTAFQNQLFTPWESQRVLNRCPEVISNMFFFFFFFILKSNCIPAQMSVFCCFFFHKVATRIRIIIECVSRLKAMKERHEEALQNMQLIW